jgi:hypothetical protein
MASAKLNRRKFIRYTAAIGGGVALSPVLHIPSVAKGSTQRDIYWYQQPLRILQTVLREPDAPESVHIGLTKSLQNPKEFIFSLVNTTSGPVRPLRSLLPVYDLRVTLKLDGKMSSHKILRSQGGCQSDFCKWKCGVRNR